ncbi:MAG TPA: sulfate ABC transporter permease subunit [Longimicrobium sp.]|nr:sulfate ABC transporter permease subunit [Longimicrobium sp.]
MSARAVAAGGGSTALRGVVALHLGLLVALPLAALAWKGVSHGPAAFWGYVTQPAAVDALVRTLWTSALVAVVNGVMGTATAWVLVRGRFRGRGILSALVDLPFAIPTLVTGIMLVLLFGPQTALGGWAAAHGVPIAFAAPGIILALLFVTLPLVVRSVEPVLRELDPAEEEAAQTLGAGSLRTFTRVVLPPLLPAIIAGALQTFARAVAEFGSIVVVSGNVPFQTLTAPVQIFGQVESGAPEAAAAVSLVLLAVALALSFATRALRGRHA